jgi:hypothetical protein
MIFHIKCFFSSFNSKENQTNDEIQDIIEADIHFVMTILLIFGVTGSSLVILKCGIDLFVRKNII